MLWIYPMKALQTLVKPYLIQTPISLLGTMASMVLVVLIVLQEIVLREYASLTSPPPDLVLLVGVLRVITITYFVCVVIIAVKINLFQQERRQHNKALRDSGQNLERRAVQLRTAAEIARDATATLELDAVLQRTVNLVCERFGFYHAGIFLVDDTNEYAVIKAVSGGPASQQMLQEQHRLKVKTEGIVGYVTGTGKPRIVMDVTSERLHFKNPYLPETNSEITLPIKLHNRIIGALDVQSHKVGAFDQDDVMILQTLADLVAVAIDKARLHGAVQQHAHDLEIRVQARTTELEYERARLTAILDSMGEGLIYDEKLRTLYINRALTEMTGYHIDEWHGYLDFLKSAHTSPQESALFTKRIFDAVARSGIWRGELVLRRKDGSEFDAGLTVTSVAGEDGHPLGAVTIIRDISQDKALQAQKSRFVANASHELRTPITNIKTRLYLLERQPDRREEHLAVIINVVERMRRLVEQLLDLSRFERGSIILRLQEMRVQELIAHVIKLQQPEAEQKRIQLAAEMPEVPLVIRADRDRIEQVLTNIITNAINYTPEGGRVRVRVQAAEQVVIEIEDTGIGIPHEFLQHVFQPFFRVSESRVKGTGLGLNISKEIIELHHGEIAVHSEIGMGSRFSIMLPLLAHSTPAP